MMKSRLTACLAFGGALMQGSAFAQATPTPAEVPPSTPRTEPPKAPPEDAPAAHPARFQLGIFGGMFFPSRSHELLSRGPYQKYDSVAPELGGRVSVLPLDFAGVEIEGAAMPTKVKNGDAAAFWAARAHLILQAPFNGITPFAVFGAGALGAASNALGSDNDPAVHFGVGAKVPLDDFIALRLDLRDSMTQKHAASQGDQTHHFETTLGLTFSLRPSKAAAPPAGPPPPAPDTDGDGVPNDRDACPVEPGKLPNGCPIGDGDHDGVADDKDACPADPGKAPCGCPPVDSDGDKVIDELDKCPKEAGPIEGCPDPDADHDGVPVPEDRCPDKAETKNGYDDSDGCPDEIPGVVKKFTGVIQGIEFDRGKETIRPVSTPILDSALKVLTDYTKLRVLISGHTDSDGTREKNVDLSKRRAESVKTYFVSRGIDEGRIETRGVGPDEPIADNKTAAGKQKNRRIEFKLIDEAKRPEKGQP